MPNKVFKSIQKNVVVDSVEPSAKIQEHYREIQPRSDDKSRSFVTLMRAVSVLWDALNPDWKSSQISFSSKKEYNCEDATFSSIFDRKGRSVCN